MRKHPVSIALSNRVLEKIDKDASKQKSSRSEYRELHFENFFSEQKTFTFRGDFSVASNGLVLNYLLLRGTNRTSARVSRFENKENTWLGMSPVETHTALGSYESFFEIWVQILAILL